MERELKKTLKIVVLGDKNTGKTALTVRFLTGKFIHEYVTGEDLVYLHTLNMASGDVKIKILDTSKSNISSSIVDADGIIIVYAINNVKSFRRAKELFLHINVITSSNLPCVAIVANKSDLWHYRNVMRSDGEYLAKKQNCKYFELSALTDRDGVDRMFTVLVKLIHEKLLYDLKSSSVILLEGPPPGEFEGRRRSRSLQLPPKEKKHLAHKSPVILRKILKSWNSSSLSRSKSTDKLNF